MEKEVAHDWSLVWRQFKKNKAAMAASFFLLAILLAGLYAPLLASSKPLLVSWRGKLYFPLPRYLFFQGFFTKPIDLFYNLLMVLLPATALGFLIFKKFKWNKRWLIFSMATLQIVLFSLLCLYSIKDPAFANSLSKLRNENHKKQDRETILTPTMKWKQELSYLPDYAQLNMLLRWRQRKQQQQHLNLHAARYLKEMGHPMPTLWHTDQSNLNEKKETLQHLIASRKEAYEQAAAQFPQLALNNAPLARISHQICEQIASLLPQIGSQQGRDSVQATRPHPAAGQDAVTECASCHRSGEKYGLEGIPDSFVQHVRAYREANEDLLYLLDKETWLSSESQHVHLLIPAFIRPFHWEDDAGGSQDMNRFVPWLERTRVNRKDLVASLIFGVRISLVVGVSAVCLSLLIGIPLGMLSGYFAGKTDIVICRVLEIWEAMPIFFTLLIVIALTQSRSIFLVITVIGIFGWTGFGRFIRGEVLKQRSLPYVMACKSLGYNHFRIMFSQILPNAIPPILTLFPFSMMAAIISEAALSFLGLGEGGSTSWGVLMDEGRSVFPAESYLLWPPAILLTVLLISIALVGDALRDAIDPKLR